MEPESMTIKEKRVQVYGNNGGFMVYGVFFVVALIIMVGPSYSRLSSLLPILFVQFLISMPIAFSAVLTLKTKGLDLSVPAMVSLCSIIMVLSDSIFIGIIISLIICCSIGVINAIIIKYLKLPGMLVTFATFVIIFPVTNIVGNSIRSHPNNLNISMIYIVILISIVVGVALAIIISMCTKKKRVFFKIITVYAGSGIFAVLYCLALFAKIQYTVYEDPNLLILLVLFVGIFFCITRFFKNNVLAVLLSLIPCSIFVLLNVGFNLNRIGVDFQMILFYIIFITMFFLVFHKGRAILIGSDSSIDYSKKTWIAFLPLLLYIPKLVAYSLVVYLREQNILFQILFWLFSDISFIILTILICVLYTQMKPKIYYLKNKEL